MTGKKKAAAKWRIRGAVLLFLASLALSGGGLQPEEGQSEEPGTEPQETSVQTPELRETVPARGAADGLAAVPETGTIVETVPVCEDTAGNGWAESLLSTAENGTYVSAVVLEGETEATILWTFYEDRESLLTAYAEKKAAFGQPGGSRVPWVFLKMPVGGDMHALDLYHTLQWEDAEEGYVYEAHTMARGTAYEIAKVSKEALETKSMIEAKKEIVVRDGYLYLFECGDVDDDSRKAVAAQIRCLADIVAPGSTGGWGLDEESLFWIDHTDRVQTFGDPRRQFTERRAVDTNWPDRIMRYFAIMTEARYEIQLSPELPEMTVTFRLSEEEPEGGYEAYLLNGFCMDELYRMEVRTKEDGGLVQEAQVRLNIDYIDTVCFRDVNADGYLDMEISYLTYFSGYDGRNVKDRRYWLWDPDSGMFEPPRGRIWERKKCLTE